MAFDSASRAKTLKDARKDVPTENDITERMVAAQTATDYEAVMVCAALLEHLLMQVISTKFVDLSSGRLSAIFTDGGKGPLSTFSAKIKISHALGLMGNGTRLQCERINTIRNHFAHHKDWVKFEDPEVSAECALFRNSIRYKSYSNGRDIEELESNKLKYVHTCMLIAIDSVVYLDLARETGPYPGIAISPFEDVENDLFNNSLMTFRPVVSGQ